MSLLAESYNPHVRYGAALALGIACAGTGMKEALALLEPLSKDTVPFVRQGAFIALAMVLVQVSEHALPKVKAIRQQLMDVVGDKHQASMAKFGAILALGIIDAGKFNLYALSFDFCQVAATKLFPYLRLLVTPISPPSPV